MPLVFISVVLGCVVVSVLAIGPKVRRFKHGLGRWIFKIHRTSFRGELKLPAPYRHIKRHVKEPLEA
jgi:hypothetical protein